MLLRRSSDLDAPRRVVALHLLFGLVTVALLTFGTVRVALGVISNQADAGCLAMIGRATTIFRTNYRHQEGEGFQRLVEELARDQRLEHCAVIGPNNVYIAHSNPTHVGEAALESTGGLVEWGDVHRFGATPHEGRQVLLYRVPLRDGEEIFASLEAAVPDRDNWQLLRTATGHGLWYIVLGVITCGIGSFFLYRMLRPMSNIERQLRVAATTEGSLLNVKPVAATSLAAIGWNRLLEDRSRQSQDTDLKEKVAAGLRGHREKKAEAILRSLTEGVALTDHEDRITFVNSALVGILNTQGDEMLGRTMDGLLHFSASANGARKFLDPQCRAQQIVTEIGRDGDMSKGVLRIARVPLLTSSSESGASHVWMVRDVTQQKLADQMRNQFVYSATHELRTPLTNIKAYAETLANARDIDVERQKEFCNTINYEASRLSRFIDDLLSISRMEAGAMALQKHETDLMKLFEEAIGKVKPEMDKKEIAFESRIPAKLPKLMADKDKLTVMLVNLLGNAAKYTPDGGKVAFEVEWNSGQILIHVTDSGIGIAQQELAKIFDKFFRSNDPRVADRTGSGLGLAIAQEIVRLHGGKITVHSELDKGSKFSVSLPTS